MRLERALCGYERARNAAIRGTDRRGPGRLSDALARSGAYAIYDFVAQW
jgi:hypothetical protein